MIELDTRTSRRRLLTGALGASAVAALSACAAGGGPSTSESSGPGTSTSPGNPFGVDKAAPLDAVIFNGGYGDEYAQFNVDQYNKWAGGSPAKLTSTTKIASQLQPRFAGGTPPDVIDNSGADQMPMAALVAQNQIADLKQLLDAPSVDDPATTVGDTLLPGTAESGSYDGVVRSLGYVFSMWGLWHSTTLFEQQGWQVAQTWDDYLDLCDKIKSTGLAPFVHTGVYPQYLSNMLESMAIKAGGTDIVLNMDNLKTNGWANDTVLAAATAVAKLNSEKLILSGAEGMDHTTSQAQWLLGKAAMIPCGSWLENEMKGKVPKDFEMVVQPYPSLTADDALPYPAIWGGAGEPFIVPEQAENKAGGLEFLRQMLSRDSTTKFAELTGSLAAVKDAGADLKNPTSALKSVSEASAAAGEDIFFLNAFGWYADLSDARKRELANLITGRSTPEQYCTAMQQAADDVAADPKVKKYTRSA